MSLSSFFQRFRRAASSGQASATDAVSSIPSDVEAARVRARRRLIGMAVLVGAGLIGFPWLFETQPRPMSQDVQVVQAQSASGGGTQASSSTPPATPSRSVAGRVAVAGIVPAPSQVQSEPDAPAAARDEASAKPAPAQDEPPPKPEPKPEPKAAAVKPVAKPPAKALVKEPPKEAAKPATGKDASKPAGKPADKPATRYVVQFGAFADANAAHEARMKVERQGAKTYAQQVDTPAGKRIRVRLGPFSDKAEADKAMATVRKAGLTGALLTL